MSGLPVPFPSAFAIAQQDPNATIAELEDRLRKVDTAIEEQQKVLCISGTLNGDPVRAHLASNIKLIKEEGVALSKKLDTDFYDQIEAYIKKIPPDETKLIEYLNKLISKNSLRSVSELILIINNLQNGAEIYGTDFQMGFETHVPLITGKNQMPQPPQKLLELSGILQTNLRLYNAKLAQLRTETYKYDRLQALGLAIPKIDDDRPSPPPRDISVGDPKTMHLINAVHREDVALALESRPNDFGLKTLAKDITERDAIHRLLKIMRATGANQVSDLIGNDQTGFTTAWQVAVNFVAVTTDTVGDPHIDYADTAHTEKDIKNLIAMNKQILTHIFPMIFKEKDRKKVDVNLIIKMFDVFVGPHKITLQSNRILKVAKLSLEQQWELLDRLNVMIMVLLQKIARDQQLSIAIESGSHTRPSEPKYVFLSLLFKSHKTQVDYSLNISDFARLAENHHDLTLVKVKKLQDFELEIMGKFNFELGTNKDFNRLLQESVTPRLQKELAEKISDFKPDATVYKTPYVTAFAEAVQQGILYPGMAFEAYLRNKYLQSDASLTPASTSTSTSTSTRATSSSNSPGGIDGQEGKVSPFSSKRNFDG